MADRVRSVSTGRQPYVDPASPANNDTTDFAPVLLGGAVFTDPNLPEDVGTEVVNATPPTAVATPTVTTGQATDHVYVNAEWDAADPVDGVPPAAQYEVYVNV